MKTLRDAVWVSDLPVHDCIFCPAKLLVRRLAEPPSWGNRHSETVFTKIRERRHIRLHHKHEPLDRHERLQQGRSCRAPRFALVPSPRSKDRQTHFALFIQVRIHYQKQVPRASAPSLGSQTIDAPRPFPFVQLRKCAIGGVWGKFASSIQSMTNGASSYGVFSLPMMRQRSRSVLSSYARITISPKKII